MANTTAASFINLDLEIDAPFDLEPLGKHFANNAFVLYQGPTDSGFRLAMEPLLNGRLSTDAVASTEHFLGAIETLPESVLAIWSACSARVFDYGFDGGFESVPIHIDIPASVLSRASKLGLSLRVTVYPFREDNAD